VGIAKSVERGSATPLRVWHVLLFWRDCQLTDPGDSAITDTARPPDGRVSVVAASEMSNSFRRIMKSGGTTNAFSFLLGPQFPHGFLMVLSYLRDRTQH
jgi:hypothetical protein